MYPLDATSCTCKYAFAFASLVIVHQIAYGYMISHEQMSGLADLIVQFENLVLLVDIV